MPLNLFLLPTKKKGGKTRAFFSFMWICFSLFGGGGRRKGSTGEYHNKKAMKRGSFPFPPLFFRRRSNKKLLSLLSLCSVKTNCVCVCVIFPSFTLKL